MQLSSGGKFLSAKTCKTGDILTFNNEGESVKSNYKHAPTFPDGKPNPLAGQPKFVNQFLVWVNNSEYVFTLGKINQKTLVSAWGGNTEKWVGKRCRIEIVKTTVGGELKDSIMLTPTTDAPPTKARAEVTSTDEWAE